MLSKDKDHLLRLLKSNHFSHTYGSEATRVFEILMDEIISLREDLGRMRYAKEVD